MRAKDYLLQLQRLTTMITQKKEELSGLKAMSTSITGMDYSKEHVQSSHSGDAPFINPIFRIIDLECEIKDEIAKFAEEKHKIINQIQGLSNSKHIDILYKHYVEFKRLEAVAVEMNYTYQYTRELHRFALLDFERTYKNLQDTIDFLQ